jgi:Raf kinase inhibitor-like YbhB/YbcL family protein
MWDEFKAPARRPSLRLRVCVLPVCVLVAAQLAGCGGGSSPTVPSSPAAAPASAQTSSVDAVAYVAGTPIPKVSYAHWRSVEARLDASGNAGHAALGFLITSQWVLDEASGRGLSTSEADVKRYLAQLERRQFPHAGMLKAFLAGSHETEADLLARARVELLREHITAKVAAGSSGSRSKRLLASFEQAFRSHWRDHTTCKPAYVMEDCSEYRGKGENLVAGGSPAHSPTAAPRPTSRAAPRPTSSRGPASVPRASRSTTLNTEQELPPSRSGEMALSSPAFELNGLIPPQYTCDGAGVSPPLRWQSVPAKAAALILFVIDDETPGSNGGIRWVVGDIDPKSGGVAAGQIPQGGIVGSSAQGRAGYGAICPPHGATSRVEFDMYALSARIPLTKGFQPSVAEYEYSRQKLLLGKVATTYGGYHRP